MKKINGKSLFYKVLQKARRNLIFGCVVISALLLSANSRVFADTPLWSFDGAKWYALMESGNLMVGTKTGAMMLDGASGKQIW